MSEVVNGDRLALIESISAQISSGALNAALSVCESLEMPLDDEFIDGTALEERERSMAEIEMEVDEDRYADRDEADDLQRGGTDAAFDADADDGSSGGYNTHAHASAPNKQQSPDYAHGAVYSPLQTNASTHPHTHTAPSSSSSSSSSLFMGRFAMLDCLSQSAGSSVYAARDESISAANQHQGPGTGSGPGQAQGHGQGQGHVVLKFITDEEAFNSETQLRHGTLC
jgi:hypothetical protein